MANNDTSEVGYGNPPTHTRFVKGKSGNPNGRPKGSQNLATILRKAGRQRIRITENGRIRYVSKFEAAMLQLMNKAVSGDLKAIAELLAWIKSLADPEDNPRASGLHERDKEVMANVVERIRKSQPDLTKTSTAVSTLEDQ